MFVDRDSKDYKRDEESTKLLRDRSDRTASMRSLLQSIGDAPKKSLYYEQQGQLKLNAFKYAQQEQKHITIPYQSIYGLRSDGHDTYTKETIDFGERNKLHIVVRESVTNDTILIWETTGAHVRSALRMGLLKPEAMTSLAIVEVGKYRLKRAKRMLYSGIVSSLDKEKIAILDTLQDRIEKLADLELCLNEPIDTTKPQEMVDKITTCLRVLEEESKDEHVAIKKLIKQLDSGAWSNTIKSFNWLNTAGYEKISSFIRSEIMQALCQAQAANQTLAYKYVWLRGDLNNHLEDAIKVVQEYRQDFHTQMTKKHQLRFHASDRVIVDSQHQHYHSIDDLVKLILGVSVIEVPSQIDPQKFKSTFATKWLNWGFSPTENYDLRDGWTKVGHFVWGACFGIGNVPEIVFRGHDANFVEQRMPDVESRLDQTYKQKNTFFAILQRLKVNRTRVSTKIGILLHKTFKHFAWEGVVKGVYDLGRRVVDGIVTLKVDYHHGHPDAHQSLDQSLQEIFNQLNKEIARIEAQDKRIQDAYKYSVEERLHHLPLLLAHPDASLTPYRSHGLVNTTVDGLIYFIDYFEHNMLTKHPFISAVSLAVCSQSFLAFFDPAFTFGGPQYKKFLYNMGYMWANDPVSASVASSFTYYKLIAAGLELGIHGADSWIITAGQKFWNDPAAAIVFAGLSWLAGHAVINKGHWYSIDIPYISEKLREHEGSFPMFAETFGGLKLIGMFYHLILAADPEVGHEGKTKEDLLIAKCLQLFVHKFQEVNGVPPNSRQCDAFKQEFYRLLMIASPTQKRSYGSTDTLALRTADVSPQASEAMTSVSALAEMATPVAALSIVAKHPASSGQQQVAKIRFAIIFKLATHLNKLTDMDPILKRELLNLLPSLMPTQEGVLAMQKALYPEEYVHKAPLRQFIGRVGAYIGTGVRCICSPLTRSSRPWEIGADLGRDDFASTTDGVCRLSHKLAEFIFNRFPRMLSDIFFNSICARIETRCSSSGSSNLTNLNYQCSANFYQCQNDLTECTTGKIVNMLSHSATPADPAASITQALESQLKLAFGKLFQAAQSTQQTAATATAATPPSSPGMNRA